MYFFCTYFDRYYLDKGLTLYRSLNRHCSSFRMWILCMDEITFEILSQLSLQHVDLIRLSYLEKDDPELLKAKQNRSVIEYYFTCTPSLALYLIKHYPEIDIITYLDADLYLFSAISPAYHEMGKGSILIISHRFALKNKWREIYGKYNVGFLAFRNDINGCECLTWWRSRCLEWCYDHIEDEKFADQKYLDQWPNLFSGVVILQNKGIGLAPWNIDKYSYSVQNNILHVDGQPIILFHFHRLKQVNDWLFDCNLSEYKTRLKRKLRKFLYRPYINDLRKEKNDLNIDMTFRFYQRIRKTIPELHGKYLETKLRALHFYLLLRFTLLKKLLYGDFILEP